MVKTRQFIERHKKVLRITVISLWLVCTFFALTGDLFAQTTEMETLWTKVVALLGGAFGKAIAALGFVGGAIAIFLGNMQAGIMAIVGAFIIAVAPIIINFLFD
jgi:type IV secretory pathway VirB2 component (pilin)